MTIRESKKHFFKIFSFLVLIAFVTYLVVHYDLYLYFIDKEKAIVFINSLQPYDIVIFIFLQVLQVVVAPLPGTVTGFIGGYIYGPFMGTIYSTIGLTIGSWLAFTLARTFGLPLVEKIVKPEVIQKYDNFMDHKGALVSFALFLIPGYHKDYLSYIMGLSHVRTSMFLIISTIGRFLGTILLTFSGSFARNDQYKALLMIVVVCGILVFAGYLYRDRFLELLIKKK